MNSPKELIIYRDSRQREPLTQWLESLDKRTKYRIWSRILRLTLGNYGDFKKLSRGVSELRLHFGAGYRVYFAETNDSIVLLLCGGDKSTQSNDIKKAEEYWRIYQEEYQHAPVP